MRRLLLALVLLLPPALVAQGAPQSAAPGGDTALLAITDITLIDVASGRRIPRRTVLVRGTRIAAVGASDGPEAVPVPGEARRIDGRGAWLIPGLIDTHVHLGWDIDAAAEREMLALHLAAGVTTVREASTRTLEPQQLAARAAVDAGLFSGPRIIISGRIDARALSRAGTTSTAELVRRLGALGVDGLKLRGRLTNDQMLQAIAEGRRLGIPVYGHTERPGDLPDTALAYATALIKAGLAGIMHVFPLASELPLARGAVNDPPPDKTDTSQSGWQLLARWTLVDGAAEESLARLIVERGVWLEPTLAVTWSQMASEHWSDDPRIPRLPAIFREDLANPDLLPRYRGHALERARAGYARMQRFVRRVHELGGTIVAGTDNLPVPAWGLHDELLRLVEAGLTPAAALRAATSDAARVLGLAEVTGKITPGFAADLVLLDADPLDDIRNVAKIRSVVANGRLIDSAAVKAAEAGSVSVK